MSDPTTLQELADSLAVSAEAATERARQYTGNAAYHAGYREALLDTRATVLAMIAATREGIEICDVCDAIFPANQATIVTDPMPARVLCPTCHHYHREKS